MSSQREALLEIGLNIVAPTVVLVFLSGEDRLGPVVGLVLALAFPLVHAALSLARTGRFSPLTVLAVGSVVLTGGIGLLELDVRWFAWKEALVPAVLAVATVVSVRTPWPVVPTILWRVLDAERVHAALEARGSRARFEERIQRATWGFAAIFGASAALTFALARTLVTSPTGSVAFNEELGRFTALSFPAVALPITLAMVVVLRSLLTGLEEDTGAEIDDLLSPAVAGASSRAEAHPVSEGALPEDRAGLRDPAGSDDEASPR